MSARVTIPGAPAVDWAAADAHLRLDGETTQKPLVEGLIAAAQAHIEKTLEIAITTQTIEQRFTMDAVQVFGGGFVALRRRPVRSIISVATSLNGTDTPVSPASYNVSGERGLNFSWGTMLGFGEVVVTYTAGDAPANVPGPLKQAILLLTAHWYANREAVGAPLAELPLGVEGLLQPYRTITA